MKMKRNSTARIWVFLCLMFVIICGQAMAQMPPDSGNQGSGTNFTTSTNPYYPKYYGQCTWFVWGRAADKGWVFNAAPGANTAYTAITNGGGQDPLVVQSNSVQVCYYKGGSYHVAYVYHVTSQTQWEIAQWNVPLYNGYTTETITRSSPTSSALHGSISGNFSLTGFLYPPGTSVLPPPGLPPGSNLNSSTPSICINPNTALSSALAQGPNNSLYAYWQNYDGSWGGPWGINGGSANLAHSSPAIAMVPSTGLAVGVCQGPNNSLYNYWQNSNGSWNGPGGINGGAANMCYSDPAIAVNPNTGQATVLAQGPSNSLYYYWQSGGTWYGPGGINGGAANIAYSTPSISINPSTGLATAACKGPNNSLYVYWQSGGGTWNGPLGIAGANTTYSAPAIGVNPLTGNAVIAVQGPSNTLYIYWSSGGSWYGPLGVNGGATAMCYSSPTLSINQTSGKPTVVAVGPSNSLYAYWENPNGTWSGPLGINTGAANTAYSVPTISINPGTQTASVMAVGPSHSLYFYWQNSINGQWSGPLGVAGPNTAY